MELLMNFTHKNIFSTVTTSLYQNELFSIFESNPTSLKIN